MLRTAKVLFLGASLVLVASFALAKPFFRYILPNEWRVAPAGETFETGAMPLRVVLDPTKRWLAVLSSAYEGTKTNDVQILDVRTGKQVSTAVSSGHFAGLEFAHDGRALFVTNAGSGIGGAVLRFAFDPLTGKVGTGRFFSVSNEGAWANALAISMDDRTAYAGTTVDPNRTFSSAQQRSTIVALDAWSGNILWAAPTSGPVYDVILSSDGKAMYASEWMSGNIAAFSTHTQASREHVMQDADPQHGAERLLWRTHVCDHPSALALDRAGRIFASCSESDIIAALDGATGRVMETYDVRLTNHHLLGAMPGGFQLSDDARNLYVAEAGDGIVARIDLGTKKITGVIPAGWFPTDVTFDPRSRSMFVVDGWGLHSKNSENSPPGYNPADTYRGGLQIIHDVTDANFRDGLATFRQLAPPHLIALGNIDPKKASYPELPPIKHVIYVIRENKTYDSILGDDPRGNGDRKYVVFGKRVTPNVHALADTFTLMDNYYVQWGASWEGHLWATSAYDSDAMAKFENVPDSGNFINAVQTAEYSDPPSGYLWDLCKRNGVSYRDYGEFLEYNGVNDGVVPTSPQAALIGHVDSHYYSFDLSVLDQVRINEWEREFRQFERNGKLPGLSIVRIGNDHTAGDMPYYRTENSLVADNDYALARLVSDVSRSRYWRDTLVISTEDDQGGYQDHVDLQRSVVTVAGAYVKRGAVDHTHYSMSGLLRTVELLLHLPPMTQFDAGATPMLGIFSKTPDMRPYVPLPENYNLDARNQPGLPGAAASEQMNPHVPDSIAADVLARIDTAAAKRAGNNR